MSGGRRSNPVTSPGSKQGGPSKRLPLQGRKDMKLTRRMALTATAGLALAVSAQLAQAQETLKIGLVATFEGPFTVLGEDSKRGAELALQHHNGMAGGKKIELVTGSSDASPDSAVRATRKLVEQ